jgi:hypothetical protein
MTTSIAIVIPTRNRADLAIEAVRSLLAIPESRLRVIVSNNSSDPTHVQQLTRFCEQTADARLMHIRPPHDLAMAEHWDWAIQQTLERSDATHLALHYDRRVSKPALRLLLDRTTRWPERAITYYFDSVYPVPPRFHVHQIPWSGGVYEIRTARALELASRGLLTDRWQAFPVLVNCVTPRSIFERIRARFGNVCASTTPDAPFGLRLCALNEHYLHFDMPLAIHYAFGRSNGLAYLRGESSSPIFGDFLRLLGDRPWLDAAPIPGLTLGLNIFWHEYALARRQSGEEKFPPIDMDAYLNDLSRGLSAISDAAKRSEMRELLLSHGWREEEPIAPSPPVQRGLIQRVRGRLSSLQGKLALLRADHLYVKPSDLGRFGFKSEAVALRHALRYPSAPIAENDFLSPFEPVRIQ